MILAEPAGVAQERREKRKREELKRNAAIGRSAGIGRRHRAICLGVAGLEPWRELGAEGVELSCDHTYRKPFWRRYIPWKILGRFCACARNKCSATQFKEVHANQKQMELDMNRFKEDEIVPENDGTLSAGDGIDRRNFLGCMAWAGTGLLWSFVGGVPAARLFALPGNGGGAAAGNVEDFSFVQISDSHIGFSKGA